MSQVLVIARDPAVRDQLKDVSKQSGVSCDVADDFEPGFAAIEKDPPMLVVTENPVDDETMAKLRKALQTFAPVTPFLVYLRERDSAAALKRMSEGAYDCLCPPLSPGDFLAAAKRSVSRMGRRLLTARRVRIVAWWRQPLLYVTLGLGLFVGLAALGVLDYLAPPFQIFKLASEHPVAAAGDKDLLWVVDWSQQNMTGVLPQGDYLSIARIRKFEEVEPVALALAPFYVYTVSTDGQLRRHRWDDALSAVASVPAPGPSPSGLAWDGETLWSCDAQTGKIYEHDARLAVKNSFAAPGARPVGIAWDKKSLWVADGLHNTLWKLTRAKGGEWAKQGPFPLDVFGHNSSLQLSGFTVWRGRAWIVSENGGVLVRHRLPKGN